MKNFVVAIGLCLNLTSFYTLAQTDEDALRYSQLFIGGTARICTAIISIIITIAITISVRIVPKTISVRIISEARRIPWIIIRVPWIVGIHWVAIRIIPAISPYLIETYRDAKTGRIMERLIKRVSGIERAEITES